MFEEFRRDIFVNRILPRELQRHAHHVQAKHSHPAGAIALLEKSAVRQRRASIEHANVIKAEKSALKNVFPFGIFSIHPPGERDQHFVKNSFEKGAIAFARLALLNFINAPRSPGKDRRIHIAEIPFVGGHLAVGMLVPLADDEIELALGEMRIDQRQRNAMEGEIP